MGETLSGSVGQPTEGKVAGSAKNLWSKDILRALRGRRRKDPREAATINERKKRAKKKRENREN